MKTSKRQEEFLQRLAKDYDDGDNIFPKPMTDREALDILCEYFLGKDWYTINPVSHGQCNVYRVNDIIKTHKVK